MKTCSCYEQQHLLPVSIITLMFEVTVLSDLYHMKHLKMGQAVTFKRKQRFALVFRNIH